MCSLKPGTELSLTCVKSISPAKKAFSALLGSPIGINSILSKFGSGPVQPSCLVRINFSSGFHSSILYAPHVAGGSTVNFPPTPSTAFLHNTYPAE